MAGAAGSGSPGNSEEETIISGTPPGSAGRRVTEDETPIAGQLARPATAGGQEDETIIRDLSKDRSGRTEETTVLESGGASAANADQTVVIKARPTVLGYLVEKAGLRAGYVHHLRTQTSLGREADNDIVINDTRASRHHARIKLEENSFILYDLASTNGTFLLNANGKTKLASPHALVEGETIQIGEAEVIFMVVDEALLASA